MRGHRELNFGSRGWVGKGAVTADGLGASLVMETPWNQRAGPAAHIVRVVTPGASVLFKMAETGHCMLLVVYMNFFCRYNGIEQNPSAPWVRIEDQGTDFQLQKKCQDVHDRTTVNNSVLHI